MDTAILLIDNAALPGSSVRLSPVRKGKILVPYLMASANWEVIPFPNSGGSMVGAIKRDNGNYADPDLEHPDYTDHWKDKFNRVNVSPTVYRDYRFFLNCKT